MKTIAFLGTGAMGSRMIKHLASAGHQLIIWNRTLDTAKALQSECEQAIQVAESPKEAVLKADLVISMVRDDEASESVWLDSNTGALSAMTEDAIGIECSTLSLPHINALSERFDQQGRTFVDAPLAGSRPQADAAALIFFVGASDESFHQVKPILDIMGQAAHHAGPVGSGAAVKLMINGLFATQISCLAELIGFANRTPLDLEKTLNIIQSTPVCSPAAGLASQAMIKGAFAPVFPIDLVSKDFQLILKSAQALHAKLPLHNGVSQIYQSAIDQGFGRDNITGIAQLFS